MVEPPKPPTFSAPVHSSQGTTPARDLVTHVTGTSRDIPIGTLLEGKVVTQTSSGLTTLQTSHGEISFQTQVGLLRGSLVTLRVTSTSNDFQARLVTINGLSLLEYLGSQPNNQSARVTTTFTLPQDQVVSSSAYDANQAGRQTNNQAAASSALERGDTVLQRNALLQTTLLNADKAGIQRFIELLPPTAREQFTATLQNAAASQNISVTEANTQPLLARSGNVFEFRIIGYQLPTSTTSNPTGQNPATTAGQAGSVTTPAGTAPVLTQNQPNTPQTTFNQPPASAGATQNFASTGAPSQSGQNTAVPTIPIGPEQITVDAKTGNVRLQAVVIGQEANGQSIIKTPLGIVHSNNTLPKGAVLNLELATVAYLSSANQITPSLSGLTSGPQDALGKLINFWNLFSTSDTAKSFAEVGRMDALQARLPNADTDLGANLLRYLSALNKQDAAELLGKTLMNRLDRTAKGQEAVDQLNRDLGLNRQLAQQPLPDAWRSLVFPVISDNTWYANRLLYKEYEGTNKQDEPERGVRFVIELEMEKLGPLQLDGLVRSTASQQFFDLTIRSQIPIPQDARDGIFQIFQEAQDELNIEGRLVFHLTAQLPDVIKDSASVIHTGGDNNDSIIV